MTIAPSWVGIDVSKHHLDVFEEALGRGQRHANDAASVGRLAERLAGGATHVVFEATGAYDGLLRQALAAAGVPFSRVNPGRARDFARADGFLAKTDAVDARMLARMGKSLALVADEAEDAARARLAAVHKRRDQLVAMRQQERTRCSELHDADLRADLERHIAWLDDTIAVIDGRLAALATASEALRQKRHLMRSVPGIGSGVATTLAALLPELGRRSHKSIAALAGLAPLNADSGKRRGQRRIRAGRRRVRQALYMAALTAARSRSRLGAFYRALRAAGKPPKLALIALARKIIVSLNAMLKSQTPFRA